MRKGSMLMMAIMRMMLMRVMRNPGFAAPMFRMSSFHYHHHLSLIHI